MYIILWILFFLSGHVIGNVESIRLMSNSQLKIISGTIISIRRRPFMVSLHFRDKFICGGSILSRMWIVTAEHCIENSGFQGRYYIRAGSSYYDRGGVVRSVIQVKTFRSQLYKYGIPVHDIILLRINMPLEFSKRIQPVKLPTSEFIPNWLWVSGWGQTETQYTSNSLRIVGISSVPYELCIKSAPFYETLLNRNYHVCYGGPEHDSCYGDSGGPLATFGVLYGIVSFGNRCAIDPGVYTKVFYYVDWIKQVVNSETL